MKEKQENIEIELPVSGTAINGVKVSAIIEVDKVQAIIDFCDNCPDCKLLAICDKVCGDFMPEEINFDEVDEKDLNEFYKALIEID